MLTARDIMSPNVVTVAKDLSIRELSEKFLAHQVNGFPVVDEGGAVIGMVTEKDLIERNRNLHIPTVVSLFDAVFYVESDKKFEEEVRRLTGTQVADIYTSKVVTIPPDMPLSEITNLMAEKGVHSLPVVDGGSLVGIIGKVDVIRGLAGENTP